jgi:ABC-type Fe3+ transport system permease subunit
MPGYPLIVQSWDEMLASENVSSIVPAAPSDPDRANRSWVGWHVVLAAVVVVVGPVVVVVVGGVVVVFESWVEEALDFDGLLEQAASAVAASSIPTMTVAARVEIRMFFPLLIPIYVAAETERRHLARTRSVVPARSRT